MKITEDYCSFEVAKLLKEKWFDGECETSYYISNEGCENAVSVGDFTKVRPWREALIAAPTHQMAMKWLREVHKVVISIDAHTANHWDGYIDTFEIDILKNASRMIVPYEIAIHNIYEEAVEAALKYSLENLI